MAIYKLENVYSPPFQTLGQALAYYNNCNPARDIRVNLLEPERVKRVENVDFSGDSSKDRWAAVAGAIAIVLHNRPFDEIEAWLARNVGPSEKHLAAEVIAEKFGWERRRTFKTLARINRDLEAELRRRHLIPWNILRFYEPMYGKKRHIIAQITSDAVQHGLEVRMEPASKGSGFELVGYAGSDRKDSILALYPHEGAQVITKDEIRRRFS